MTIRRLIDRGFPSYDYPAIRRDATMDNYRAFEASAPQRGTRVEAFAVGNARQLGLERDRPVYPRLRPTQPDGYGEVMERPR